MLIDTHAHIYAEEFDSDAELMLKRANEAGVSKVVMPNVDMDSMPRMLNLARLYPGMVYSMAGLHPCSVGPEYVDSLNQMEDYLNNESLVAIGEVGLDFYWDTTYVREQEEAFLRQAGWGKDRQWPVIIHSRNALDRLIVLIQTHYDRQLSGIFHCFSGTVEQARAITDQGFYLGIGGVITYKNSSLPEVIKTVGLDQVVVETDAPYLSPVPYRGKRNEPAYIVEVVKKLSEVLGKPYETVANQTTNNAQHVFKKI